MKLTRVEKGDYIIHFQDKLYEAVKGFKCWTLYKGVNRGRPNILVAKRTLRECKEFVKVGYTPGNYSAISTPPMEQIDKKYKSKRTGSIWRIDDVVYSTARGRWIIDSSFYNNSIDEGRCHFDIDEWEENFEEVQ